MIEPSFPKPTRKPGETCDICGAVADVAKAIGVSASLIRSFETTGHFPQTKEARDRRPKLKAFFEAAGVKFTTDAFVGARLRNVEP